MTGAIFTASAIIIIRLLSVSLCAVNCRWDCGFRARDMIWAVLYVQAWIVNILLKCLVNAFYCINDKNNGLGKRNRTQATLHSQFTQFLCCAGKTMILISAYQIKIAQIIIITIELSGNGGMSQLLCSDFHQKKAESNVIIANSEQFLKNGKRNEEQKHVKKQRNERHTY